MTSELGTSLDDTVCFYSMSNRDGGAIQGLPTAATRPTLVLAGGNKPASLRWRTHHPRCRHRWGTLPSRHAAAGIPRSRLSHSEPVLLSFAPLAFRLRGFERAEGQEGPMAVVQEWHCEAP
jgi:hypothetical protein